MASWTQWTWVWANSGRWWRTGKPGVLPSMGWQRVGHDWAIEQQVSNSSLYSFLKSQVLSVLFFSLQPEEFTLAFPVVWECGKTLTTNSLNFPFKYLLFHLHPRGALLLSMEFYIDRCFCQYFRMVFCCLLVSIVSDKSVISWIIESFPILYIFLCLLTNFLLSLGINSLRCVKPRFLCVHSI